MIEMRGVGAVDHVIGRTFVGCVIDAFDRFGKCLSGRQAPIGLHGEGDDRRAVAEEMSKAAMAMRLSGPNKGLELTASSVRSCLAPASGSSSGLAISRRFAPAYRAE